MKDDTPAVTSFEACRNNTRPHPTQSLPYVEQARVQQDVDDTQTSVTKLAEAMQIIKVTLTEKVKEEKKQVSGMRPSNGVLNLSFKCKSKIILMWILDCWFIVLGRDVHGGKASIGTNRH